MVFAAHSYVWKGALHRAREGNGPNAPAITNDQLRGLSGKGPCDPWSSTDAYSAFVSAMSYLFPGSNLSSASVYATPLSVASSLSITSSINTASSQPTSSASSSVKAKVTKEDRENTLRGKSVNLSVAVVGIRSSEVGCSFFLSVFLRKHCPLQRCGGTSWNPWHSTDVSVVLHFPPANRL